MKSQLQNSLTRKIALLSHLAAAAAAFVQVCFRRRRTNRHAGSGKNASKSSIFRCRGVLQLALPKKRCLTLLEVAIALFLLGILLSGLFHAFRQGVNKNIQARQLRQTLVPVEFFQQSLRNLLQKENGVWIDKHDDAVGTSLFIRYQQSVDADAEMSGELSGMLFLNSKKELSWVSWSANGKARMQTLLEGVDAFQCRLFDPKEKQWTPVWPKKREDRPVMIAIDLMQAGQKKSTPFVFFLDAAQNEITYQVKP